jgi:hypothetical protein
MTARHRGALAALLLALGLVVVVWVARDRRPPEWDHANHLERAVDCRRDLAALGRGGLDEILARSSFYPPIVTCAAGLLYFVLPVVPLTAQAVMWAFLVVGTLALWGLGRRLLDADAGLLAAFLFATAPFVVFSLPNFQLDLPLAAMVALALYVLARSEELGLPRSAIGLGVVRASACSPSRPSRPTSRARSSGWRGGSCASRIAASACSAWRARSQSPRRSRCRGTGRA